jgi:hypothetical protein
VVIALNNELPPALAKQVGGQDRHGDRSRANDYCMTDDDETPYPSREDTSQIVGRRRCGAL